MRRLAIVGAGTAAVGAGGATLIARELIAERRENAPQIVVLPNAAQTPETATPTPSLSIISRDAWGATAADHSARNENGFYAPGRNPEGWYVYPNGLRESYQTLVIHHSAIYENDGLSTLREIQRLHREDRGWADIGYHFLVDKDGAIYQGRELQVRGVHTAGYNTGSAGICLLGDYRFLAPPAAQMAATAALIAWLAERLQPTHLAWHQQFNRATACPGAQLITKLAALAAGANLQVGIEGYVPVSSRGEGCHCCGCGSVW